jgi:hypothetical protein
MAESGFDNGLKWAGYIWTTFIELITLSVALLVLVRDGTAFERIVLSILVILYASIQSVTLVSGMSQITNWKLERDRFFELMAAVGSPRNQSEMAKEHQADDDAKISSNMVKGYIRATFLAVIYLAAVVGLVTSLLS